MIQETNEDIIEKTNEEISALMSDVDNNAKRLKMLPLSFVIKARIL
jgi:hypothetical protein